MRASKAALLVIFGLILSVISCENPWMAELLDPLVQEREGNDKPGPVYTIKLDIDALDARDSVSLSPSGVVTEIDTSNRIVPVYYNFTDTGDSTQRLRLSFISGFYAEFGDPAGGGVYQYTVNSADAVDDVITITVISVHTSLLLLDAPTDVNLTKEGGVTFTAGANNPAATAYVYTLYKNGAEVSGFKDKTVISGGDPGLKEEMLKGAGEYKVKVKARGDSVSTHDSFPSDFSTSVTVYSLTVNISGDGTDSVKAETADVTTPENTASFVMYAFNGTSVTLKATPGEYRYFTAWGGDVTGTGLNVSLTITGNAAVTATFAAPVVTVTTQPAAITNVTRGSITGSLSVTAGVTPAGRTINYQWYYNTANNNTGGTEISGAESASFTIPADLIVGSYYYFCEVSTPGGTPARSNVAAVIVGGMPLTIADFAVTDTGPKEYDGSNQGVTVNYAGGITVTRAGAITVYYSGTGGTVYSESITPPRNAGNYSVRITTAGGEDYAPFNSTIGTTLVINRLQLTILSPSGDPVKTADGTTAYNGNDITLGALIGVIGGDDVTPVIFSATYDKADETASYITIVYAITGADAGNYIAPVDGTIAATIKVPGIFDITLTVQEIKEGAPSIGGFTLSFSGVKERSVSVADTLLYDSIEWKIAGVGAYAGDYVTGTGSPFTVKLDAASDHVKYNTVGQHVLILTVVLLEDGKTYQVNIPFTITD